MTKTIANQILSTDRSNLPVSRGWHLDGAGPARFGWAWRHPAKVEYLGRTWDEVTARARETVA